MAVGICGWIWLPDRVQGAARVVWRTGGDYCGWAPLPPGAIYVTVRDGFIIHSKHVAVGFDFGLGWTHFSFCYTRELGEPLRAHWRKEAEIRTIFNRTTVINNYTVRRVKVGGETRVQVFNHGIDPDRVGHGKNRDFETVKIHELETPAAGRAHEHFDEKKGTISVYRPKFGGRH